MSLADVLAMELSGADQQGYAGIGSANQGAMRSAAWGTAADVGGSLLAAYSHMQFGMQARAGDLYQAQQLRMNAGQAQASAQRQAYDVNEQAKYIASAAQATAAASGAGASDPTVLNLMARNAGQMAYRQQVALYQGEDRARMLSMEADAKQYEGQNTARNSMMVAGSQVFRAGSSLMQDEARMSSLYQRFGGGGPQLPSVYG